MGVGGQVNRADGPGVSVGLVNVGVGKVQLPVKVSIQESTRHCRAT